MKRYDSEIKFIKKYTKSPNAATGSAVDSNANVENKNITTLNGEIPKKLMIGINRTMMYDKQKALFGEEVAEKYIEQLEKHQIYKHDETSGGAYVPYCVSITMYPYLFKGMKNIGGISEPPKNLQSFCGSFVNLVFAVASQFAGAVSTPEFLTYMDYFIRKEYGDDYYKRSDEVVDLSKRRRDIDSVISQCFQEVVYSLNQPAAARNYQSVFWNIAYFDRPYFESIFEDFVFPDGTEPQYESVLWLQKKFMNWFNRERLRTILTFPVETVNLLDNGVDYVDKEFADFVAEMWAKGHSFFMYRSNSVDSLASCCYSKDTYVLIKDSKDVYRVKFEDIESIKFDDNEYKIFNNGRWCKGKLVKLPNRQMYKVTLTNNKEMIVTDNHRNNVFGGMKLTKDLTTNDYLMVNSTPYNTFLDDNDLDLYRMGYNYGTLIRNYRLLEVNLRWAFIDNEFRRGLLDGVFSDTNVYSSLCERFTDCLDAICTIDGCITRRYTFEKDGLRFYCLSRYNQNELEESEDNIYDDGKYYFRIKSIEKYDYDDEVYCFEMDDKTDDMFTLANGIHNYNCRLRNELQDNTFSYTLGAGGVSTGSKSVITINFNRLVQDAYKHKEWKDKEEFYDYLDSKIREQVRLVHKYQIAYDDNLRDFLKAKMLPIYDAGFINMDKQFLTVGINGLVEGAEFLGIDISPNEEYFEYCTRCLKPIYEENKAAKTEHYMFNTEYVPKLCGHLAA